MSDHLMWLKNSANSEIKSKSKPAPHGLPEGTTLWSCSKISKQIMYMAVHLFQLIIWENSLIIALYNFA